jgi:hypothetical protein
LQKFELRTSKFELRMSARVPWRHPEGRRGSGACGHAERRARRRAGVGPREH